MRDLHTHIRPVQVLSPAAALTGDAQSAGINLALDPQGQALEFIALVGPSGDALSGAVKIELFIEESDDDGAGNPAAWAPAADEDVIGDVQAGAAQTGTFAVIDDATKDDQAYSAGYKGHKQHARFSANFVGAHPAGTQIAGLAVKGRLLKRGKGAA